MPQMAPMNWTLLFMIFILLYLATMTLIYFNIFQMTQISSDSKRLSSTPMTWKW